MQQALTSIAPFAGTETLGRSAPDWRDIAERAHCVQFYRSDDFLIESVGAFFEAGLGLGEAGVIIATPEHINALQQRLLARGFDLATAQAQGKFFALDAAETLHRFMVDGMPDRALFEQTLNPIFSAVGDVRIRAFGEMVALLWAEGRQQAALELERLWNELALTHRFALLCGYPLHIFGAARQTESFAHVCDHHGVVAPAESDLPLDNEDSRRREISILQQKAAALEAEVAEREAAEQRLRERQSTLTMATALAGLGIWELESAQHKMTCCERAKSILGWSAQTDLSLDRLLCVLHPQNREAARTAIDAAFATGAEINIELRLDNDEGNARWIALQGQCVDTPRTRLLGVILDISERKNAAAALEQTVAERTARLRETVADLEAFSYSISHDMRSPLRAIHGYADILMQECQLEAQHSGYLNRIGAAAQRMDRLIEDVLAFSRVARADLQLVPVDLSTLIGPIVDSNPALQPPQAALSIDRELPLVLGNHAILTQCLSNLLNNAVKFVAPGTMPQIRLWAQTSAAPNGQTRVRINITDNGIGIDPLMQEKVFAIFERLSTDYEGTGIGLAIVKKAVERMGGSVGIESRPGAGSTFWLELLAAE